MCRFLFSLALALIVSVVSIPVLSNPTNTQNLGFSGSANSVQEVLSPPATNLPLIHGTYQFTFDNVSLSKSEDMGLIGGNYLFANRFGYVGLGIYGAVTGDRGGFFTGGLHAGKNIPLFDGYYFDGNLFLGGGGGGSAPQGGGLMLRGALGLGKQVGDNQYFLGVSKVSFPNGDIESSQVTFAYGYKFSSLYFPGWLSASYDSPRWENILREKRISNQQLSMQILNYYPGNGVSGRNSKVHEDVLSTLGIRFSHKLNRLLWGEFETAGAMGGGIDGFAQVLGGFSLKHMLFSKVGLSTGWLLGAAGGGNVDTGGGMITRVYTGVEYFLFRRWSTYLQFGYTTTPDGGFYAKTMNLNIVYNFSDFSYKTHLISQKESGRIKWRNLRIRPGVQKYTFYDKPSRKFPHQKDLDVDLTNLKLDAFFNTRWYFTGQALGAFRGKAGGYAVGLIGPGVQINRYIGFELPVGVAGGGGIAVGSGKIVQPMLNFELPHSRSWASELSAGYIKAMDDSLSAFVFNIGLVYRFSRPYI